MKKIILVLCLSFAAHAADVTGGGGSSIPTPVSIANGGTGTASGQHIGPYAQDWATAFSDSTDTHAVPGMATHFATPWCFGGSVNTWNYTGLLPDTANFGTGVASGVQGRCRMSYGGTAANNQVRGITKGNNNLDGRNCTTANVCTRFRLTGGFTMALNNGVIANTTMWFGVTSVTLAGTPAVVPPTTSTALATTQYVAIGYKDTVNGGRFVCASGNGTNHSGVDMGVTAVKGATNTTAGWYSVEIDCTNYSAATPSCKCGISSNNAPMVYATAPSATMPGTVSGMGFDMFAESNTVATGDFDVFPYTLWE